MTNHSIPNINKPRIYISGEVHGDERVGPNATLELIKLFVNFNNHPWLRHLLNTRLIIITPMTNPHGYYVNEREEQLIEDEDKVILTNSLFKQTHKDINRDFPYLVNSKYCMESIGARVVNELFLKHKFLLSLSLHGGTESLTYPYGTPNHIQNNPKIQMNYIKNEMEVVTGKNKEDAMNLQKLYLKGDYDDVFSKGISLNPPDYKAITSMTKSANEHTTSNKSAQYKIGDMNTVVYPVRGGMEDWAYSASWEGHPIINQPCKPKTYNGYPEEKTKYDGTNHDGVRNIMLLLEVSHKKFPEQKKLGRQNIDCLLNLKKNAFFNTITPHKTTCLNKTIDGYIPRIIRLNLTLIDLLEPYINYHGEYKKISHKLNIKWLVGGSLVVDKTKIMYETFDKSTTEQDFMNKKEKLISMIKDFNNASQITNKDKIIKLKGILTKENKKNKDMKGLGIWNTDEANIKPFEYEIDTKDKKYILFVIIANVDSYMKEFDNSVDPAVPPQTHFVNLRTNNKYIVKNEGDLLLQGRTMHTSNVGSFNIDKKESKDKKRRNL